MVELDTRDLKTSDAAKLLQEYRFQRESSLRSIQHSRLNLALTCFIIAFAALQIGLSNPRYESIAYDASAVITLSGLFFAFIAFSPVKKARNLRRRNEEFVEKLEDYFSGR